MFDIKRKPAHPGEILKEDFMKPLGLTQTQLAEELNTTFRTINEIINEKRNVSPEMAIKLARYFGTSEELWMKLDYKASDAALEQARKLCPDNPEIYWRMARNEYGYVEMIPRDQKPGKEELLKRYTRMENLADKCIELDENDGECRLWKAVAMGRRGSTQGVLRTVFEVDEFETALLETLKKKPEYKSENGSANSMRY